MASHLSKALIDIKSYDPAFKGSYFSLYHLLRNNSSICQMSSQHLAIYLINPNLTKTLMFYEVHIRLHEPLWKSNRSLEEISVGILVLSAQLEGLCRECYTVS